MDPEAFRAETARKEAHPSPPALARTTAEGARVDLVELRPKDRQIQLVRRLDLRLIAAELLQPNMELSRWT